MFHDYENSIINMKPIWRQILNDEWTYFRLAESVQGTDLERIFKTDDLGTEEKEDEVQTASSEVKESRNFEQVTFFKYKQRS